MFKGLSANSWVAASLALAVSIAVGRIHLSVQTTLVGYGIASLKEEESKLLEERSALKVQLSKLTTKKHLMLMTETIDHGSKARPNMASTK